MWVELGPGGGCGVCMGGGVAGCGVGVSRLGSSKDLPST